MKDHPEEHGELKIVGLMRGRGQIKRQLEAINWGKAPATLQTIMELEEELSDIELVLKKEFAEAAYII